MFSHRVIINKKKETGNGEKVADDLNRSNTRKWRGGKEFLRVYESRENPRYSHHLRGSEWYPTAEASWPVPFPPPSFPPSPLRG